MLRERPPVAVIACGVRRRPVSCGVFRGARPCQWRGSHGTARLLTGDAAHGGQIGERTKGAVGMEDDGGRGGLAACMGTGYLLCRCGHMRGPAGRGWLRREGASVRRPAHAGCARQGRSRQQQQQQDAGARKGKRAPSSKTRRFGTHGISAPTCSERKRERRRNQSRVRVASSVAGRHKRRRTQDARLPSAAARE
jgi:hypothetical protein